MDYTELRNISNQLANLQIGRLNNDYWNRRYFMYFDETNNTKKLLIKLQNNGTYKFNNNPNANFVLGGVVMQNNDNITYEELCSALGFQKNNARETKSTSIFYGNFPAVLKSKYFEPLIKLLLNNHWYIHFTELNLLYYSIVDIIDSLELPQLFELSAAQIRSGLKDILYRSIRNYISDVEHLFVEYNYPDIASDKISLFIESLITIVKKNDSADVQNEHLSLLIRILSLNIKTPQLVFIQEEQSLLLIPRYFELYCHKIYMFNNSQLVFDKEDDVMKFISEEPVVLKEKMLANYRFRDSKEEPLIQLSDYIVRIIAMYMCFLEKDIKFIETEIENFSERQLKNFTLFQDLLYSSVNENPFFFHSINCMSTIPNRDFLMQKYKNIT